MTFADITAYFERLAVAHKSLKASYVGDYDDIYKVTAHPDRYNLPCLWIETAEMTPVGQDDSVRESWSRAIVVLFKGDPQDMEKNKYQIEQSYRVARSLLYRIMMDAESMNVRFSIINKSLRQIDPLAADFLVGWRIDLDLEVSHAGPCFDQDEWDETIEVTNTLSFTLVKTETGYEANALDSLDGAWTMKWKYSIEKDTMEESSVEVLEVTSTGANIYVILEATHSTGLIRQASAFLESSELNIKSVPYLYSKYR